MLDIKYLRQNIDFVAGKMRERGQAMNMERFIALDVKRRDVIQEVEGLRSERNTASKLIGEKKKKGEDAGEFITRTGEMSNRIKELDETLKQTDEELQAILMTLPNVPHESVICGKGAEDNPVVRVWGEKGQFSFTPRPHWEIGENLNILDFARGAKITGARFTLYRGLGARLERAIINFMLDLHTQEHGYTEMLTPFMVNRESMTGTG
ncbi:MAG: serine--tRNA ligase, partial [Syntrophus sp. (in: bacteria)]|nr:serine--tRNA ligase [Syntrophus sp. (in: bacteria)]